MKYSVTIQDKSYVVEIEDINARPVIAYVEGIRVEVIPDTDPLGIESRHEVQKEAKEVHFFDLRDSASDQSANEMTAPLPGTVIEVFVKEGDVIESGQVIVIIEAMKMKKQHPLNASGEGRRGAGQRDADCGAQTAVGEIRMNFAELLPELLKGLANFTAGNAVMITAALLWIYLAAFKEIEPVLLLPIGFGCLVSGWVTSRRRCGCWKSTGKKRS